MNINITEKDLKYCPKCGYKKSEIEDVEESFEQKKKRLKMVNAKQWDENKEFRNTREREEAFRVYKERFEESSTEKKKLIERYKKYLKCSKEIFKECSWSVCFGCVNERKDEGGVFCDSCDVLMEEEVGILGKCSMIENSDIYTLKTGWLCNMCKDLPKYKEILQEENKKIKKFYFIFFEDFDKSIFVFVFFS